MRLSQTQSVRHLVPKIFGNASVVTDSAGCMNALAHYLLLLARHSETAEDDSEMSKEQARNLYHRLEAIDGDRKERYRDMAAL